MNKSREIKTPASKAKSKLARKTEKTLKASIPQDQVQMQAREAIQEPEEMMLVSKTSRDPKCHDDRKRKRSAAGEDAKAKRQKTVASDDESAGRSCDQSTVEKPHIHGDKKRR